MQIVIPLVMTVGLFGAFGGESMTLLKDSGWIFGKIAAGTPTWVQNAGFAWLLSLVPLSILCWFGMNNLLTVSPNIGGTIAAFLKITWLYTLSFVPAIVGMYLYLPAPTGLGLLEHVGGDRANHYQHSVHAETDGLRHDERRCRQAVRNLSQ